MYICQICKKMPATIHLTDIHNNVKKEVHICESCAAEKGFNLQSAANLPQLLGLAAKKGVTSSVSAPPPFKVKAADQDLICLHCGTTWSQFGERGRLGCPHDYQTFDARLRPLVANQIAADAREPGVLHVGKRPGPAGGGEETQGRIRALTRKLRSAVAEENYEAAARLKSELDKLRGEQPGETHGE
ncbi:MAG: UvrB/UvrC motif-containing protein [Planctomycetota bacterium]|jgi:protein arginine kinase activator|nr:UvrB/UvrC motif-containing protein [Planctomycetota bacterium]